MTLYKIDIPACYLKLILFVVFSFAPLRVMALPDSGQYCAAPEFISEDSKLQNDVSDKEKYLRVLIQDKQNGCVISNKEKSLIENFALLNELEIKWIGIDEEWKLLPELVKGNGDIIVAQDKDIDGGTEGLINFTHSWTNASYKVVERSDSSRITRVDDLAGRQVVAYESSDVWNTLVEFKEILTGMVLEEIPATMPEAEVMKNVKTGQYDLAIIDSMFLDEYLPNNPDLRASFNFTAERNMAWAVSADASDLHKTLNHYLNQQALTHNVETIYFDDLPLLKDRGVIRIITNSNPSHYYLQKGKLLGFEYELIRNFASNHRMRVEVVIAENQEQMFKLLQQGKGDIVAASLPGNLLEVHKEIQYTNPYDYSSPVIVGRQTDGKLLDLRELKGRRITLSQDSPYWKFMSELQKQNMEFELVKTDDGINLEGTLLMVAMGMYDLTVIGSHELNSSYAKGIGLQPQFVLAEPSAHQWAVRYSNQQLLTELNRFIKNEYRSKRYNVLHAKYFNQPKNKRIAKNERLTQFTSLSPYDDLTQTYANRYGFDWRLITALMFQESQFNPDANSYAGAVGLMQLIPSTAELMGVSDTNNPETSIYAGIRYLSYLRDKFEDTLSLQDRTWFALASYNAGYGRVKKARELATTMGLDKDQWFDNVELAMLALAKPYYNEGKQERYCRCGQAVVYVREIRTRYNNYIRLMEKQYVALYQPINKVISRRLIN
ncbi:MAG: transporter substrate-binding domain-containing protein [Proteobacteria bacterium]|nr:transporter substrate-binding domain-containing protein [Pseudomonadota bacterium]